MNSEWPKEASQRLEVPESWETSLDVPTLYPMEDEDGKKEGKQTGKVEGLRRKAEEKIYIEDPTPNIEDGYRFALLF